MLDRVFTLAEVADSFHLKEPWLRDFIRRRGIPVLRSEKLIRFDRLALDALTEALRDPCPSTVFGASKATRRPSRSAATSTRRTAPGSTIDRLRNRLRPTPPSSKRKSPQSPRSFTEPSGSANVVALDPSGTR